MLNGQKQSKSVANGCKQSQTVINGWKQSKTVKKGLKTFENAGKQSKTVLKYWKWLKQSNTDKRVGSLLKTVEIGSCQKQHWKTVKNCKMDWNGLKWPKTVENG